MSSVRSSEGDDMPILQLAITVICLIAIIAVILWFVSKMNIGPPIIYIVYAGIAILCILVLLWIVQSVGGGLMHVSYGQEYGQEIEHASMA